MAIDVGSDNWSEWILPDVNKPNYSVYLGSAILDEKHIGDVYTCQVEIEFLGVTSTQREMFRFCTQGTTDGSWRVGNPWNRFVWITTAPEDGVYRYTSSCIIDEEMVKAEVFQIGFRCDNWNTGAFRVKDIKIEKGDTASIWTPGL